MAIWLGIRQALLGSSPTFGGEKMHDNLIFAALSNHSPSCSLNISFLQFKRPIFQTTNLVSAGEVQTLVGAQTSFCCCHL